MTTEDWGKWLDSMGKLSVAQLSDELAKQTSKRIAEHSEASAKTRPVSRDDSGNVYDAADTSGAAGYWTGGVQ